MSDISCVEGPGVDIAEWPTEGSASASNTGVPSTSLDVGFGLLTTGANESEFVVKLIVK